MSFYSYCPNIKSLKKAFTTKEIVVIILEDKHQDQMYAATSEKGFASLFLRILKERMEAGGYYYNPYDEDNQPEVPSLSEEAAKQMPEGRPKKVAFEDLDRYKKNVASHKEECRIWDEMQNAIVKKDGWAAYLVLSMRSPHQYEGIRIEFPEVVS